MTSTTEIPEERPVANASENDPLLDHPDDVTQDERNIWSNLIAGEIIWSPRKSYCELTIFGLTDSAGLAQIGIWVVSVHSKNSQCDRKHRCCTPRQIHQLTSPVRRSGLGQHLSPTNHPLHSPSSKPCELSARTNIPNQSPAPRHLSTSPPNSRNSHPSTHHHRKPIQKTNRSTYSLYNPTNKHRPLPCRLYGNRNQQRLPSPLYLRTQHSRSPYRHFRRAPISLWNRPVLPARAGSGQC